MPAMDGLVVVLPIGTKEVVDCDKTDIDQTPISLQNSAPVANAGLDISATVNKPVILHGSGTDNDGDIVSYEWREGSKHLSDAQSFTYTPTTTGIHTLTLVVTDDDGESDSDEVNINVLEKIDLLESPVATDKNDTFTKIHFKLSRNAQAQVEYGIDAHHTQFTTKETSYNYSEHTQRIENLKPFTVYHYKIHFWDENGNETVSDDFTFKTSPLNGKWRTGYYFPGNAWRFKVDKIPFDMYTHMIEAFVLPMVNADGSPGLDTEIYKTDYYDGGKIEDFVSTAHKHYVKALFALKSNPHYQGAILQCTSEENIDAFVAVLAKFINDYNYDGIDIDWEAANYDGESYVRLVKKLRKALGKDKIIMTAGQLKNKAYISKVIDEVDQVNMMFYDMYKGGHYYHGEEKTWYNTAVRNPTGVEFDISNLETIENGVWYMLDGGGMPPEKLGIGIPFYGRIIQALRENNQEEGVTGPLQPYQADSFKQKYISYFALMTGRDRSDYNDYWIKGVHHWDDEAKVPYISYDLNGSKDDAFITYTDPRQIRESVRLMKERDVGGMMTFVNRYEYMENEVGDARYPLSKALVDAMDGVK